MDTLDWIATTLPAAALRPARAPEGWLARLAAAVAGLQALERALATLGALERPLALGEVDPLAALNGVAPDPSGVDSGSTEPAVERWRRPTSLGRPAPADQPPRSPAPAGAAASRASAATLRPQGRAQVASPAAPAGRVPETPEPRRPLPPAARTTVSTRELGALSGRRAIDSAGAGSAPKHARPGVGSADRGGATARGGAPTVRSQHSEAQPGAAARAPSASAAQRSGLRMPAAPASQPGGGAALLAQLVGAPGGVVSPNIPPGEATAPGAIGQEARGPRAVDALLRQARTNAISAPIGGPTAPANRLSALAAPDTQRTGTTSPPHGAAAARTSLSRDAETAAAGDYRRALPSRPAPAHARAPAQPSGAGAARAAAEGLDLLRESLARLDLPAALAAPDGRAGGAAEALGRPAPPERSGGAAEADRPPEAPAVQNTFNVTVHMAGGMDGNEEELAERLNRILVEQARRHGIDV